MNAAVSEGRTRSVPLKAAAPKARPPKKAPPKKEPAKAALDDREQQDLRLLREHTAALNRIDGELMLVQQDVKREEDKLRSLGLVAELSDNQLTAFATASAALSDALHRVRVLALCQEHVAQRVQQDRARMDAFYGPSPGR
jgi:predicted oxidoreductase